MTFTLTFIYFAIEVVDGILTNSLALLADAVHILADVDRLALALFAAWISHLSSSLFFQSKFRYN